MCKLSQLLHLQAQLHRRRNQHPRRSNRSVKVDIEICTTITTLPFKNNPLVKLSPNREITLRVYIQQLKHLLKHVSDKQDIIKAEKKTPWNQKTAMSYEG